MMYIPATLVLTSLLTFAGSSVAAPTVSATSSNANSGWTPPVFLDGPVITSNFPDPALINARGVWYAFATNTVENTGTANITINIQVAKSTDFTNWELVTNSNGVQVDALPNPPSWVNMTASNDWAPDVIILDDGSFVMYFSAQVSTTYSPLAMSGPNHDVPHHCVGAATSKSVIGPYTALAEPLACPLEQGGAIDPAGFKDWKTVGSSWGYAENQQNGWSRWWSDEDANNPSTWPKNDSWGPDSQWSQGGRGGQRYVVYKVDGNSIGNGGICGNTIAPISPTPLLLQAVAADGVTPQGPPTQLLDNRGVADDGVTEAPALIKAPPFANRHSQTYVLFFSSGCYSTPNYTVSYAVSTAGVAGPYTRAPAPLLRTGSTTSAGVPLFAPGGMAVLWDARHAVLMADKGNTSDVRQMYVAEIAVEPDGSVSI